jgi:hypothetical protein
MELKYDWNDEVILQFYSTLYLDKKSSKLFWMTDVTSKKNLSLIKEAPELTKI